MQVIKDWRQGRTGNEVCPAVIADNFSHVLRFTQKQNNLSCEHGNEASTILRHGKCKKVQTERLQQFVVP